MADFFFFIKVHALFPEKLTKMVKNALSCSVKDSDKKCIRPSLYPEPYEKLMGSILGRDSSSIPVSWRFFQ